MARPAWPVAARGGADRCGGSDGAVSPTHFLRAVAGIEDAPLQRWRWNVLAEADILLVAGPAARQRLSLQACAHPGRGLRESPEESASGPTSPHRRDFAGSFRRQGGGRARSASPSFHASRPLPTRRLNGGARPATRLCAAPPSRRRSRISARRSRWRTRRLRVCAVRRGRDCRSSAEPEAETQTKL